MSHILVAEDEEVIRVQLARRLKREGYDVSEAASVEAAKAVDLSCFDLVISDLRLPGAAGTDLIDAANDVPVLIMTSFASIASAIECMKRGAADYIAKPFEYTELLLTVSRILEQSLQRRQNIALKNDLHRNFPVNGIVGQCPAMLEIADRIHRIAATDVPVLILGESGTGKELVARALHSLGKRNHGPFIAVNSAAIPENLIEDELFGHERGAFTGAVARKPGLFAAANGGTLFLDEVGDLALSTQVRLLRVLQDGEIRPVGSTKPRPVNVRVIAPPHRDLAALTQTGDFREDLFYRINVMDICLPPLRERGDDIDLLADHLLIQIGTRLGRSQLRLDSHARHALHTYDWPGNIRELANCLERGAILCDQDTLTTEQITPILPNGNQHHSLTLSLDDYFRDFILRHQGQFNEAELARRLGISRKSLWERRKRMDIPRISRT